MWNVLYVEDDAASRSILRLFQRMNPELMKLTVWEDSQQFEERLLALAPQPDLILLDIHVKPSTGFEMLIMARKHSNFDRVPVVALTASVMNEEIELLQKAGFQGVIAKPLKLEEFPVVVEHIMAGQKTWYVW